LLKKISIESKVQKHSEFISILLSLAKLSIAKIENIYMRVQKNRKKIIHTTKKISYAYTINISLRNYEVMNLGVETETKKILNGKRNK